MGPGGGAGLGAALGRGAGRDGTGLPRRSPSSPAGWQQGVGMGMQGVMAGQAACWLPSAFSAAPVWSPAPMRSAGGLGGGGCRAGRGHCNTSLLEVNFLPLSAIGGSGFFVGFVAGGFFNFSQVKIRNGVEVEIVDISCPLAAELYF